MRIGQAQRAKKLIEGFVAGSVSRKEIEAHRAEIQAYYDSKPLDAFGRTLSVDDLLAMVPPKLEGQTKAEVNRGIAAHGTNGFNLGNTEGPHELSTRTELLATTRHYRASVLVLGHGSKGQIGDLEQTKRALDAAVAQLDAEYGKGQWLAVFGGDPLNAEAPDVAAVVRYLQQEKGAPVLAIQSDKVKEWGGVDAHLDYVHYVPTTEIDGKIAWGGLVGGKPVGPTAEYLGADFTKGADAPLKRVIAVGGGPIALDEVKLAASAGVPISYVRSEAKHAEVAGRYGAVDDWALGNRDRGVTVFE